MYIVNHQEEHLSCTVLKLFFHGMFCFVLFLQDIYRYLKEHTVLCRFCTLESHPLFHIISFYAFTQMIFLQCKIKCCHSLNHCAVTLPSFQIPTHCVPGCLAYFMERSWRPPVGQVPISLHIESVMVYMYYSYR